ncbi:hypothetical protein FRC12_007524 [Ceratobasidium sp. 428]|nr:hypothetical protein FRC12_007524 [Ceratobasidium sp. 428]
MGEYQNVQLSDIKFVKNRPTHPQYFDTSPTPDRPNVDQPHITPDQFSFGGPGNTPYEPLAADKPGEQLAPEGAIWKMYVDEAKEHDSELVDGKNRNLDMMLLFAALFSAILTAFIIESKDLLQEDSADFSATLLLAIAQSQQRMEQGNPQILPLIERPEFSSSMSARWINGLWFTALALSLSAALVAMLAKEWLTAFVASRPRPALSHALLHQQRLQGLVQCRALHVVDFLPTMLHISLLLFFLGLAIYLWMLDWAIAIAIVILSGTTVVFYIVTGLLGALNESCPYATQISKYLRVVLVSFSQTSKSSEHHTINKPAGKETTDEQLRALLWLIDNTRDPAVGDCACQALAGIQINLKTNIQAEETETTHLRSATNQGLSRPNLIYDLYNAAQTRFTDARLRLSQAPVENQGMHMAQYASAMPALVYSLEAYVKLEPGASTDSELRSKLMIQSPAVSVLQTMDTIWTDDCPGLTPDAYATLTAADLRFIRAVIFAHHSVHHNHLHSARAFRVVAVLADDTSSSYDGEHITESSAIEMQPLVKAPLETYASRFQLRARYSRNLVRTGYLLSYHNRYNVTISARPLVYLLESIRLTAQCSELNPSFHLSTCLLQSENDNTLPSFDVNILSDDRSHTVDPFDIGDEDGIIAGLVQVIASAGIQNNPSVELAAGRCLVLIGPMLLKQWVTMMNKSSERHINQYSAGSQFVEHTLECWPKDRSTNQLEAMAYWTLHQLLVIATIAVSLADCPGMIDLSNIACIALCRRAMAASGRAAMFELAEDYDQLLSDLTRSISLNSWRLHSDTSKLFLNLLLTESSERSLFRIRGIRSSGLPHLFRLLAVMPVHLEETQKLLADLHLILKEEVDKPYLPNKYLLIFTSTTDGLRTLSSIGNHPEYRPAVTDCIVKTVHAINRFSRLQRRDSALSARAVPGFLEVVYKALIINAGKSRANVLSKSDCILSLMGDVLSILRTLDPKARNVAETRAEAGFIYGIVRELAGCSREFADIAEEMAEWGDADAIRLQGLDQLFVEW